MIARRLLAVLACLSPAAALAQQPTQAQISAIRGNCRADYQANCASVPPGGAASLACLREHQSALSGPCRAAVEQAGGAAPQRTAPATAQPAGAVTPANAALWPHEIKADGAAVTVYEPQVIAWPDRTRLTARAAVAITPAGQSKPFLGTVELEGDTTTDFATREVVFSHAKLLATHFPTLDTAQAARVDERVRAAVAALDAKRVPLDSVLLSLGDAGQAANGVAVNNDAPAIQYRDHPASLLVFDGDPVLAPISGTQLQHAVNASWPVVYDSAGPRWFVLTNGVWSAAADFHGPWTAAGALPASFRSIPDGSEFADIRRALASPSNGPVPDIVVSTVPAELIVTAGPPVYAAIPGTGLQYVSNTESDLFRDKSGTFYYLVSGRWFSAPGLDGPWTFATPNLPPDFALIPPNSPRGRVLVSVPGTPQAQTAVLQAEIPRQATLKRQGTTIQVSYAGEPNFVPVQGTSLAHAVNSPYPVIKAGDHYYVVWQGAWFVAPAPTGPWVLAAEVPAEIYAIPPSSPLYPVTYVKVYASTPTSVTYGYTAGYAMGFVTAGLLVYGTGYYYPPVVVAGPVPAYFPYPYSYAGGVAYNPATGTWARGGAVYGPYGGVARGGEAYNPSTGAWARGGAVYGPYGGGAGAWTAYNPATGRYSHGSAAWGPYGGSGTASTYNPRTGVAATTHQNENAYGRWGSSVISGPGQTVHTESGSNAQGSAGAFRSTTGAAGAGVHGANGNSAAVARGAGGNVYAGANGNVYRHTSDGWSKWNDGSWNQVQKPNTNGTRSGQYGQAGGFGSTEEGNQLERDRTARTQGSGQQRQFMRGGQGGGGGWSRPNWGEGGGRFRR
ncbi:MAG: hypothetical protein JOZ42_04155 [Acetobacteraceae bacterium]|nr:hypothetical protein [Acetobacteraceae bacterium]